MSNLDDTNPFEKHQIEQSYSIDEDQPPPNQQDQYHGISSKQGKYIRKASTKLQEAGKKLKSTRIAWSWNPFSSMSAIQWSKVFYWLAIVLAALFVLTMLLSSLIGAFELLSVFVSHTGAAIIFGFFTFFFIRFVIVLVAFPTSNSFVKKIIE